MEKNNPFKPNKNPENKIIKIFDSPKPIIYQEKPPLKNPQITHKSESIISFQDKIENQNENVIISHKVEKTIFENKLDKKAEEFQAKIVQEVTEADPTLPDYHAAYRRLNDECNAGWKLNPSDIADFYLLEQFLSTQPVSSAGQEDSDYLATLHAKDRISEIGKRMVVALAHEQLDEYDRFHILPTDQLPAELRKKIHQHFVDNAAQTEFSGRTLEDADTNLREKVNFYLSDFKELLDGNTTRTDILKIFQEKDMLDTALQILQYQQVGRWQVMATAMRALVDPTYPLGEVLKSLSPGTVTPEMIAEFEKAVGQRRDTFLIDRLINYVHNTGHVSSRITNNLPRSLSMLVAHGVPGMSEYLLYHSSFVSGQDTLSKKIHKTVGRTGKDIVEELITYMSGQHLFPMDYAYALLLEFDRPEVQDILTKNSLIKLSPTLAYRLLSRVSQHDGTTRLRIKKRKKKEDL